MTSLRSGAVRQAGVGAPVAPAAPRPGQQILARQPLGVTISSRAGAVVLTFDTPDPGTWTAAFRALIVTMLLVLRRDPSQAPVVLTGPRLFVATGACLPDFTDLLAALTGPGALVIAAIPGDAIGPGLELALACQARVATAGARLQLPGIRAGAMPVNGGIPHLAARLEPAAALEMIAFGEAVTAPTALRLGLIDMIAADDLVGAAAMVPARMPIVRTALWDIARLQAGLRRRAPSQITPHAVLHAMDQARRLPWQRGLAETRRLALALHGSDEAIALRHASAAAGAFSQSRPEIADRLCWALLREAIHLLDDGATPRGVDLALRGFGMVTPPFVAADRLGLDVVARDWIDASADAWVRYSPTLDLMLDAGRLGRAVGRGWYVYPATETQPQPDPAVDALLADSARALQRRRQDVTAETVVTRCLSAAIGAAAALCETGPEIDAISLTLGFPAWRGGLWHYAETVGLPLVAARLDAMHAAGTVPPTPARLRGLA